MTITSAAMAPTAPITMAFEVPPPEDVLALPVGPVEEELEALSNSPGPISGVSKNGRCKEIIIKRWRRELLPPAAFAVSGTQKFSSYCAPLVHVQKNG